MFFLMILGMALWICAHFYKRMMPEHRQSLGDKGKGMVALALLVSIILMVIGYSYADYSIVYDLPGARHLTILLMIIAVLFLGLGQSTSRLLPAMRHPMLTGFAIWCGTHLLVNGDSSSIVLFGGLGVWSVAQMWLINSGTGWAPAVRKPGTPQGDIKFAVIVVVVYVVLILLHMLLIKNPFTG